MIPFLQIVKRKCRRGGEDEVAYATSSGSATRGPYKQGLAILLTVLIGLCCVLGVLVCIRVPSTTSITGRGYRFGGLQFAMMLISFMQPFVDR